MAEGPGARDGRPLCGDERAIGRHPGARSERFESCRRADVEASGSEGRSVRDSPDRRPLCHCGGERTAARENTVTNAVIKRVLARRGRAGETGVAARLGALGLGGCETIKGETLWKTNV